jgi:hypothetical protein
LRLSLLFDFVEALLNSLDFLSPHLEFVFQSLCLRREVVHFDKGLNFADGPCFYTVHRAQVM